MSFLGFIINTVFFFLPERKDPPPLSPEERKRRNLELFLAQTYWDFGGDLDRITLLIGYKFKRGIKVCNEREFVKGVLDRSILHNPKEERAFVKLALRYVLEEKCQKQIDGVVDRIDSYLEF